MEQVVKPHCGARLDRPPDCRWHTPMFAVVVFGLLVYWGNAVDGLILAQLEELGWADNSTTATFSAITTAGMLLGVLGGEIIGDKTGHKNAFTLYEAIYTISMVAGVLSPNMIFPIACHFVTGARLGALLVTLFVGFTRYMLDRNRSTWSSRVSLIGNRSHPFYSPIVVGLTPLISAGRSWRVQLMISAALSLVAIVIAWRNLSELPRQLESHGHYVEAEKVMWVIEKGVVQQIGKSLPPVVFEDDGKAPHTVPYSALLAGVLLKRVILGSFVLIAMSVVQYTLISWPPTIFVTRGINLKDSIVLNTMNMFSAPFGTFTAMLVMGKISRRTMGVGLLMLVAVPGYIYSLQVSMLLIVLIGFSLTIFVYMYVCHVPAVYVPEIWPTEVELRGSGLTNAVGRINGTVTSYAVTVLFNDYGVTGVFVLLDVVSTIVAIATATIGIETKGVSVRSLGIDAATSR